MIVGVENASRHECVPDGKHNFVVRTYSFIVHAQLSLL